MKTSLLAALCLFFSILMSHSVQGQSTEKFVDSLLSIRFTKESPGGVVLVAKQGKILYKKAFGMANLELNVPMKTDQVFRIGSNTKQFTAVAILKLAEEGKLALSDDITKFIKDYPTNGKSITIEDLLTHTSGIKNYTGMSTWNQEVMRKDLSPKALVDFFKNEPLDFEPGSDYRYNNSGYILLGYIIESVSGKPYSKYIEESIFRPLDMKYSFYDRTEKIIPLRTPGYKRINDGYENSSYLSMTLPYAAGGLLSNVEDFYKWYTSLAEHKESLEKAQSTYIMKNGRSTGYGYGWEIGNVQGIPSVKHVGVIKGFITYAVYVPSTEIFIAIFSNCECAGDLDYPASQIAGKLMDKPYAYNDMRISSKELFKYQAIYNTKYEGLKVISLQDDELYYYNKGGVKSKLAPFAKDRFYIKNTLISINFQRNPMQQITGFNFSSSGLPVKAVRTNEFIKSVKAIELNEKQLEKYVGNYDFGANFLFEVIKEGTKLYGKVRNDRKELIPFEKNKFFVKDMDATLIFKSDRLGNISELVKIQNSEMKAKKIIAK